MELARARVLLDVGLARVLLKCPGYYVEIHDAGVLSCEAI